MGFARQFLGAILRKAARGGRLPGSTSSNRNVTSDFRTRLVRYQVVMKLANRPIDMPRQSRLLPADASRTPLTRQLPASRSAEVLAMLLVNSADMIARARTATEVWLFRWKTGVGQVPCNGRDENPARPKAAKIKEQ